jgi:hypothetical protein
VKDALDELGMSKVARSIPGAEVLTDAFTAIASLGNAAHDGLLGHYKDLKVKLARFTDIRYGQGCVLWFGWGSRGWASGGPSTTPWQGYDCPMPRCGRLNSVVALPHWVSLQLSAAQAGRTVVCMWAGSHPLVHTMCVNGVAGAAAQIPIHQLQLHSPNHCKTHPTTSCCARTYDPDYQEFGPSGKQVRQGVVRKVVYAFNSVPLDFVCAADETPIVEAAVRTLYNCKQTLSPYIRYPCPGKGGCTLDYNTTWWVVGPTSHLLACVLYTAATVCLMCAQDGAVHQHSVLCMLIFASSKPP